MGNLNYNKKVAFTLAEVLITLGIIGVVAAITIPGLITKYRRVTAETKLKKFYTIMNQAVRLSIADNGEFIFADVSDVTDKQNAQKITEWYGKYILPYLAGVKTSFPGGDTYIKVLLNDGTGFVSYMQYENGGTRLWVFYCLDGMDKSCTIESYDGRRTFLFSFNIQQNQFETAWFSEKDLNILKDSCYNTEKHSRHGCSQLIKLNSWKIPDDYPWL